jgi:hypothetical protein
MSELSDKQKKFTLLISKLIQWAYEHGYELTFGDAYRNPEKAEVLGYYKPWSYHCKRLAVDLNLFKDGKYLTRTEDHKPLGEFWESIGGTWGGRWHDGNHYSLGEGGKNEHGL